MKIFHLIFVSVVTVCILLSVALEKRWIFSAKSKINTLRLTKPLPSRRFTFVVCAYNCEDVCNKTLDSLFQQNYRNFSVIYIDDGSEDKTYETAKAYQSQNPNLHLTVYKHEERKGLIDRLYETIYSLPKDTIVIPLKGNTWLKSEKALQKIAKKYQNYDIWLTLAPEKNILQKTPPASLKLPHFSSLRRIKMGKNYLCSFYAGLFQKVKLQDFFFRGDFVSEDYEEVYLFPMLEMAQEHVFTFSKPLSWFVRRDILKEKRPCYSSPLKCRKKILSTSPYAPLLKSPALLEDKREKKTDYLIFSYNRPMQLYALLESSEVLLRGIEQTFVIYRSSNPRYEKAYEKVKKAFPKVHFIQQSQWPQLDFRPLTLETIFTLSKAPYILFAVDDIVIKDSVNLEDAISYLEKTKAYCFSLRLGKNIDYCYMGGFSQKVPNHILLQENVLAWQMDSARGDWTYPHSLDTTIYRKEDLYPILQNTPFKNPNEMEWNWSNATGNWKKRRELIGLCYVFSKTVNIPLNIVFRSNNPHMDLYTAENLLEKFEKGFFLDTKAMRKMENKAVYMEYYPSFIKKLEKEDTEKSLPFESSKNLLYNEESP